MRCRNTIKPLLLWPLLMAALFPVGSSAKEVTVKHNPEISLQAKTLNHRVCLYDGQEYSLGAILVVDNIVLECKPENGFESNGRLKWHKAKKKG